MVNKKGKRKLEYNGKFYYWYIRNDMDERSKIHIISDDKKLHLIFNLGEIKVCRNGIRDVLHKYFSET